MDIRAAIHVVSEGQSLSIADMEHVMRTIMTGEATPAQIGGFLIALRMKGETVDEITAAARVMRELATPVVVAPTRLVDTCGTGGDAAGTFNISTASAFVVAAAGGRVAKHGNRSVSSRSGSADVLEAAGVRLDLTPEEVARCVDEVGVGFMFAPQHHSAMRHAVGPRREMGVRTIFNLLGPLTNPATAPNQVVGVFGAQWVEPLAHVLRQLGSEHVLVVHADDGLDELSVGAPTRVAELKDGEVLVYEVRAEDFGLHTADTRSLAVSSVGESLAVIHDVFGNVAGPARDIVALNAGAAIYAGGLTGTLADGVRRALDVITGGEPRERLQALADLTRSMKKE